MYWQTREKRGRESIIIIIIVFPVLRKDKDKGWVPEFIWLPFYCTVLRYISPCTMLNAYERRKWRKKHEKWNDWNEDEMKYSWQASLSYIQCIFYFSLPQIAKGFHIVDYSMYTLVFFYSSSFFIQLSIVVCIL